MKRVLLTRYPRTRVNPVANIIIKNNLLAVTLILTALPADLKVSRNLVESVGYTIGQYLGAGIERPEVSSCFYQAERWILTAVNVARSHRNPLCVHHTSRIPATSSLPSRPQFSTSSLASAATRYSPSTPSYDNLHLR